LIPGTESNSSTCANCGTQFNGNYCHECGQKKFDRNDFTIKEFSRELMDEIFDLDSKLFSTIQLLVFRPGHLTLDYLEGKQKSYIGPVKLYLFIIALNFLVYNFFDAYSPLEVKYLSQIEMDLWIKDLIFIKLKQSGLTEEAFYHQLNLAVNNTFSIALYFLIFVFALTLKLFYFRKNRYYIEHLIFCLHFMSFGFLRDTLFLPLYMYFKDLAVALGIVTTLIYFFLAIKPVYGNIGFKRALNAIALYGIFFLLFALTIVFSVFINLL
jgi:hypothetical protein